MFYKPIVGADDIIIGEGSSIVVLTGWTVKELIQQKLDVRSYAALGNMYSPNRGLSMLIRNLLANPDIKAVVGLEATSMDKNARSIDAITRFFLHGFEEGMLATGRAVWKVCTCSPGVIDRDIPEHALRSLRQHVRFYVCEKVEHLAEWVKIAQEAANNTPYGVREAEVYMPPPTPAVEVKPASPFGHVIRGATIQDCWPQILHRIRTAGKIARSSYGEWQEMLNLTTVIEKPRLADPLPEWMGITPEFSETYIDQILQDPPITEGVKYTYGNRLRSWFDGQDQIANALQALHNNRVSTRIVMSLWDPRVDATSKTPPCLNHIWVRIRTYKLIITATLRSNDMYGAWPANALGIVALQDYMVETLQDWGHDYLERGEVVTISQSAHLYQKSWEDADYIIQNYHNPKNSYADPAGNFIISTADGKVIVVHRSLDGEDVKTYQHRKAEHLYKQIAKDCPWMQVSHAMYLGYELMRAQSCIESDIYVYTQDKPFIT